MTIFEDLRGIALGGILLFGIVVAERLWRLAKPRIVLFLSDRQVVHELVETFGKWARTGPNLYRHRIRREEVALYQYFLDRASVLLTVVEPAEVKENVRGWDDDEEDDYEDDEDDDRFCKQIRLSLDNLGVLTTESAGAGLDPRLFVTMLVQSVISGTRDIGRLLLELPEDSVLAEVPQVSAGGFLVWRFCPEADWNWGGTYLAFFSCAVETHPSPSPSDSLPLRRGSQRRPGQ